MEEYIVNVSDHLGWWTLRSADGPTYNLNISKNDEGKFCFLLQEVWPASDPRKRMNALSGWIEVEIDALLLHGERLQQSWQEHPGDEGHREERSVYDGPIIYLLSTKDPASVRVLRVSMPGPFENLRQGADLDRAIFSIGGPQK